MACAESVQDRIVDLAAGRLRGPQRWLLARHLRSCPECRALHADASALWRELAAMASEPVSPGLEVRILRALGATPVPAPTEDAARRRRPAVRILVAVCAIVVLTVAGVAIARRVAQRPRPPLMSGSGRLGRPAIRISGDYHGLVELLEPDKRGRSSVLQTDRRPSGGTCLVEVEGQTTRFMKPGTYPIRDRRARLIAYLRLGPNGPDAALLYAIEGLRELGVKQTPKTMREAEALRASALDRLWDEWGSAAPPPSRSRYPSARSAKGSMGRIEQYGLSWKVSGYASVAIQSRFISGTFPGRPPVVPRPYTPEVTIVVRGQATRASGWGCFHVVDAKKHVLADIWVTERGGGAWQAAAYLYPPLGSAAGEYVPALPVTLSPTLPPRPAR